MVHPRYEFFKKIYNENKIDYIFTAQPVVFATSSKGYSVFKNVQTDFVAKTNGKRIIQASVFINKNTDTNLASLFLKSLKKKRPQRRPKKMNL